MQFSGFGGNEGGISGENVNFTSKNCNVQGFGEITWNSGGIKVAFTIYWELSWPVNILELIGRKGSFTQKTDDLST